MISILWFVAVVWLVILALTLRGLTRQKFLTTLQQTTRDPPFVSILVPARNEEQRVLEQCIRSILEQDYGKFEVIAINDRSTDATGAILAALATTDNRLHVIEGREPPAGWLGKPHAMHQALQHARGEWILATDADMIFKPSALSIAVAQTVARNGDALTLLPRFEARSFWEFVMIPAWAWIFLMFTFFYRIHDPQTDRAVGIGGFFLMRRSVLDAIGGYEALRDEVMEDVRLADRIKRSGATLLIEEAPDLISTRMYRNFGEMWESSTKHWFSGVGFSLPFALFCVVSMYAVAVAPPVIAIAAAIAGFWSLFIPAALSWMLQVLVLVIVGSRAQVSAIYAFTAPLGIAMMYAMLLDSAVRITIGKGVTWKGRRIYERSGVRPPRTSLS